MSLPSRERGLKLKNALNEQIAENVAPLAGAWIEIFPKILSFHAQSVAPLAGAWIEIVDNPYGWKIGFMSLPSRERGLKFQQFQPLVLPVVVAPLAGAWIEILGTKRTAQDHKCRSPRGSVD